ncbi:nucleoside/nucleotide kinase family protein [Paenirhodobacter populi]|uniref:nucleoside/nucleotide kinase family protein n=1 Tax=Paenirhodobacter populi TaxID=2306993 RepID=UPI001F4D7826|nr:nucleoside/nucleotide kinase family protein [Sinirhodobacter populi]
MEKKSDREIWLGDSNGPMGDVGAFMESELRVDRADLPGHIRQLDGARNLIAVVGAPGSGKSRLARELCTALNEDAPDTAAIVAMDGFHLDNDTLDARGMRHIKGAPETFDVAGFIDLLQKIRTAGAEIPVPTFDRSIDAVVPGGARIAAGTRFVLVEGNYLLLTRPGWHDLFPLFDLSIRIDVAEAELRRRLLRRWRDLPEAEALRKVEENDLPNGRMLRAESRAADLVVRIEDTPPPG